MERLLNGEVTPATEGEQPLENEQINNLLAELNNDWEIENPPNLEKTFEFDDFMSALEFVNKVGEYAEEVNHHPLITFTWGKAIVSIYTHDVDGLREEDFFWAAHVEQIYQS